MVKYAMALLAVAIVGQLAGVTILTVSNIRHNDAHAMVLKDQPVAMCFLDYDRDGNGDGALIGDQIYDGNFGGGPPSVPCKWLTKRSQDV
jgi:hypothetical protein